MTHFEYFAMRKDKNLLKAQPSRDDDFDFDDMYGGEGAPEANIFSPSKLPCNDQIHKYDKVATEKFNVKSNIKLEPSELRGAVTSVAAQPKVAVKVKKKSPALLTRKGGQSNAESKARRRSLTGALKQKRKREGEKQVSMQLL